MDAHEVKYEALAHRLGVAALVALIPATPERIRQALAAGDEHLNTIPLASWDRAADAWTAIPKIVARTYAKRVKCPHCEGGVTLQYPTPNVVWSKVRLSFAERVCVLKHVAKFHLT